MPGMACSELQGGKAVRLQAQGLARLCVHRSEGAHGMANAPEAAHSPGLPGTINLHVCNCVCGTELP